MPEAKSEHSAATSSTNEFTLPLVVADTGHRDPVFHIGYSRDGDQPEPNKQC
jgi:hypothetical protein